MPPRARFQNSVVRRKNVSIQFCLPNERPSRVRSAWIRDEGTTEAILGSLVNLDLVEMNFRYPRARLSRPGCQFTFDERTNREQSVRNLSRRPRGESTFDRRGLLRGRYSPLTNPRSERSDCEIFSGGPIIYITPCVILVLPPRLSLSLSLETLILKPKIIYHFWLRYFTRAYIFQITPQRENLASAGAVLRYPSSGDRAHQC